MAFRSRFVDGLSTLAAEHWNALEGSDNPFTNHLFLLGLEATACASRETGWQPQHWLAEDEHGRLLAAAPCYLKFHSRGEFVFDWAWADAWQRHGQAYYPKLLVAVPFSPVPGPRLLLHPSLQPAERETLAAQLAADLDAACETHGRSSWHLNFHTQPELFDALDRQRHLPRHDWQFHWHNPADAPLANFDQFLASLNHRKRKNIRRERQRLVEAGIHCRMLGGADISDQLLAFAHACYADTHYQHGNPPSLNLAMFEWLREQMPENLLLAVAVRGTEADLAEPQAWLATAVFIRSDTRLYGRYWGCREFVSGLHFELCYYQGIDYCIRHGLEAFEPGAQGEHKIPRGFSPVRTRSLHYIQHPGFRSAIADYLAEEAQWMDQYRERLDSMLPFRQTLDVDDGGKP